MSHSVWGGSSGASLIGFARLDEEFIGIPLSSLWPLPVGRMKSLQPYQSWCDLRLRLTMVLEVCSLP